MLGKMLDFSILYDDGVVKKQAGSTRTAAAPVTTSGGHHKIETNMRLVHSTGNGTRRRDPNLQDAVQRNYSRRSQSEKALLDRPIHIRETSTITHT